MQEPDGLNSIVMANDRNAYWVLKGIGNTTLREHIYKQIPGEIFDSHDFTNSFVKHFNKEFDEMIELHKSDGDMNDILRTISNLMGVYLGKNRKALGIQKIGISDLTVNLNLTFTRTSQWRKTEIF